MAAATIASIQCIAFAVPWERLLALAGMLAITVTRAYTSGLFAVAFWRQGW
jgi:hypothetical protein